MNNWRSIKFLWQRVSRGWDDSETWNLDARLSEHIVPRLQRFKELTQGYPCEMTYQEWMDILDKMIFAHTWLASDCTHRDESPETWQKVQEGIQLFGKHYADLWW